jgi:saccharopine dehydrogenase-like NADP-dependent oxidoreductase
MRILVVGSGGVGSSFAAIASRRTYFEKLIMTDINEARAQAVVDKVGDPRLSAAKIDASDRSAIAELAKAEGVDAILNAADPRFVQPIFYGAFDAGATYVDMAMTLSHPHETDPYSKTGEKLGDEQFEHSKEWEDKGMLALVGCGVEPGLSNIFARYAQDHLFSEIDELGVRDGANLVVEGYEFAPSFSIWTTIEECLNPPVIWEKDKGWFTTPPFSEPEVFTFPEGIGPTECVNVEHEEVLMIPRWVDAKRVTFKYGLGDEFIDVLKTLHKLGLDKTDKVKVGGVEVSPRDVVAAVLPDPSTIGPIMSGKTCAGTWVTGKGKDGNPREVYLYHVADNQETMALDDSQAVVWQTAINPVIALELISDGTWKGTGVLGPEAFDAVPFLDLLKGEYNSPWGMEERTPKA